MMGIDKSHHIKTKAGGEKMNYTITEPKQDAKGMWCAEIWQDGQNVMPFKEPNFTTKKGLLNYIKKFKAENKVMK